MNENDLRVIKTRENIEQAFLALLAKKPLDKISIVELAREARINKGTFYLHFTDIMDLYHKTLRKQLESTFDGADYFADFFDHPKRFFAEFSKSISAKFSVMQVLTQGEGMFLLLAQTLDLIRAKLYATSRIRQCAQNDIKLDALFVALLVCKPRYEAGHKEEMETFILSMISSFKAV